jgi:hypothetical protein
MSIESDRLTRLYGEMAPGQEEVSTDWIKPRDALRAELAPQSLADRIMAEDIEGIACRIWHEAYDKGFSDGSDAAFVDALAWVRDTRTQYRTQAQTFCALSQLEALIRHVVEMGRLEAQP